MTDIERLARSALADVRATIAGSRGHAQSRVGPRPLGPGRGRHPADLPGSVDDVPDGCVELFGWVLREGVTNVVRHSGAALLRSCWHRGRRRGASTTAPARRGDPGGHGLTGLSERATCRGRDRLSIARLCSARLRAAGRGPVTSDPGPAGRRPGAGPRRAGRTARSRTRPRGGGPGQPRRRGGRGGRASTTRTSRCSTWRCRVPTASRRPRRLRAELPDVRVLMVTTFGRPGYLRRAMAAGRQRLRRQGHPCARSSPTPSAASTPASASSIPRWRPRPSPPAPHPDRARDRGAPGRPRRVAR